MNLRKIFLTNLKILFSYQTNNQGSHKKKEKKVNK